MATFPRNMYSDPNEIVLIPCDYPLCGEVLTSTEDYEIHELLHLSGQLDESPFIPPTSTSTASATATVTEPSSKNEDHVHTTIGDVDMEEKESKDCVTDAPTPATVVTSIPEHKSMDIDVDMASAATATSTAVSTSAIADDGIPCEYSSCNGRLIPISEYQDHMHLHLLQQESGGNGRSFAEEAALSSAAAATTAPVRTETDEAVLAMYQADIIVEEEEQKMLAAIYGRELSHTQGYSTSPSFEELGGYQRPTIAVSERLITNPKLFIQELAFGNNLPMAHQNQRGAHFQMQPTKDLRNIGHLMSHLEQHFSTRNYEYYLCDPINFFWRGQDDRGWGCGFRNFQTLCSALLHGHDPIKKQLFSPALFDGVGFVPNINQLQRYLDYAHAQGFDVHGMQELGAVEGSKTWIGAVDVTAVLRSFHIPACVFDFVVPKNSKHEALLDWVWQYFRSRYDRVPNIGAAAQQQQQKSSKMRSPKLTDYFASANAADGPISSPSPSLSPESHMSTTSATAARLGNDFDVEMNSSSTTSTNASTPKKNKKRRRSKRKKSQNKNPNQNHSQRQQQQQQQSQQYSQRGNRGLIKDRRNIFIPPLYFQHQGHSRSIIGICLNRKSNVRHLLILDPSVKGGGYQLLQKVKQGNINQLTRTINQVKALKYQIIAIPTYGVMTNNDRLKTKEVHSTLVMQQQPF